MSKRMKCRDFPNLTFKEAAFVIEYTKDFAPRRAAEAVGLNPDSGYKYVNKPNIIEAIDHVLTQRLDNYQIDAEWVLMEAVDNHLIARQLGNITASNTALKLVAQHTMVDALASKRVEVEFQTDKEVLKRLMRGRQRLRELGKLPPSDDEVSFM
jgi:hypothetical protein